MREDLWSAYVRQLRTLCLYIAGIFGLLLLMSNYPVLSIRRVVPIGIALSLLIILWKKRRVRPVSDGSKGQWTLGSTFEDTIAIEGKPDRVLQGCFLTHVYKATNGISDEIHFAGGRVVAYSNFGQSLSVRMHNELKPGRSAQVGATLKEVLSAYGTPTQVLAHGGPGAPIAELVYGSGTHVYFRWGVVESVE